MRSATGGAGLVGVLLLGGALFYTGAGGWIINNMQGLSQNCFNLVPSMMANAGGVMCRGYARGVDTVEGWSQSAGDFLRNIESYFHDASEMKLNAVEQWGGRMRREFSGLASPADQLSQMIARGPGSLSGQSIAQQFQQAVDGFTIGQYYLQQGGGAQALPWLQQSARQPGGFGLMSQLSLGGMYGQGAAGVPANPMQAQAYYQLALGSLAQLQTSNTPQAQQILQTLPVSPQQMQQQIAQAMQQLQPR